MGGIARDHYPENPCVSQGVGFDSRAIGSPEDGRFPCWFQLVMNLFGMCAESRESRWPSVICGNLHVIVMSSRHLTATDGTTHAFFKPLSFIARLVALVPKPRVNGIASLGRVPLRASNNPNQNRSFAVSRKQQRDLAKSSHRAKPMPAGLMEVNCCRVEGSLCEIRDDISMNTTDLCRLRATIRPATLRYMTRRPKKEASR